MIAKVASGLPCDASAYCVVSYLAVPEFGD